MIRIDSRSVRRGTVLHIPHSRRGKKPVECLVPPWEAARSKGDRMRCHTCWVVVLAVLAIAAPAYAADHGARINEIGLSKSGDTTIQFIEILDTFGGEPYPNSPYRLEFFDTNDVSIGTTTLSLNTTATKWY